MTKSSKLKCQKTGVNCFNFKIKFILPLDVQINMFVNVFPAAVNFFFILILIFYILCLTILICLLIKMK